MAKIKITLERFVFNKEYEQSLWTIILGLFMGIFWIYFIIWIRVIRKKLPREITGEPFSLQFWIILCLLIFFGSLVIFYLKKLQKNITHKKNVQNKFITWDLNYFFDYLKTNRIIMNFGNICKYYILRSPLYLWRFLYFNLLQKYHLSIIIKLAKIGFLLCSKWFHRDCNYILRQTIVIVFFCYIPRIFVFSIFCCEIILNKRLVYFYFFAVLLLIPLIFLSIRRILFDISYFESCNIQRSSSVIRFNVAGRDNEGFNNYELYKVCPEIPESIFLAACRDFLIYDGLLIHMTRFYQITMKYNHISSLFVCLLLMISFLVWLLVILNLY